MDDLKVMLKKWFVEWMWCKENGVKKNKWYVNGCEVNLYEMVNEKRLVVERNLVVSMEWGYFDKIKVMDLVELSELIWKGDKGSFGIGGENVNDKWREWRFVIEKDEDSDEDGFVLDGDNRCCWFVINGSLIREGK